MSGKWKKTLFWLAVWYIAWWLVASLYGKKTGTSLRQTIDDAKQNGEWTFKVLVDNFIGIHSNMIDSLKDEIMTEENINTLNNHKEELIKLLDQYKLKWNELLNELKKKGIVYADEASLKLKQLYDENINSINKMKDMAPKKSQELKEKLKLVFEEIALEMENIINKN